MSEKLSRRHDHHARQVWVRGRGAEIPPDISAFLRVESEECTAFAMWERISYVWSCTKASHPLQWMKGMNPGQAKLELLRRGCKWQWRETNFPSGLDPVDATVAPGHSQQAG